MILNIFKTPTTSTIERIVIMCTMICSFTTISNLTQLLLWRLTRPCSSDHQHKLPKHVWRTLFSKNCLNYCMVHARAPFPASSELLENIVIATGTQSFLTTWWFASPLSWSDHDDQDEVGTSMFHTGGDPGSTGLAQVQRGKMELVQSVKNSPALKTI